MIIKCECDPKERNVERDHEARIAMLEFKIPYGCGDQFQNVGDWDRRFKAVENKYSALIGNFDEQFTMKCKLERIEEKLTLIADALIEYRTPSDDPISRCKNCDWDPNED